MKNNKKGRKNVSFIKTFILSVIIFGIIFYFWGNDIVDMFLYEEQIEKETISSRDDKIVFLLVGVDANDESELKGQRTDTMVVTGVDFNNSTMSMMSIPRDSRVLVNGNLDKINHAHAYGGMDLTMTTVKDFLDMNIEHYVRMDYTAVREVVDAIGGIEIDIPFRMEYEDTTEGKEFFVDLEPGLQTLNGDQSIQFLRWRKNNDGSGYPEGDVGRVHAQQYFMKELVKQTIKPRNILKFPKLLKVYNNHIDTNIPLKTVLRGAWTARKMDLDNIETVTVPGESQYLNSTWYFIPNETELKELLYKLFGEY